EFGPGDGGETYLVRAGFGAVAGLEGAQHEVSLLIDVAAERHLAARHGRFNAVTDQIVSRRAVAPLDLALDRDGGSPATTRRRQDYAAARKSDVRQESGTHSDLLRG